MSDIQGRVKVDTEAVKRIQEEWKTWTATCSVCKAELVGTLSELRKHTHGE